jgi:hypothetical protein
MRTTIRGVTMFSMFRDTVVGLGAATLALVAGLPLPAHAAYIVTLEQVGSNVVATGSGSIDTTDLSFSASGFSPAGIIPNNGTISTGSKSLDPVNLYLGITGPVSFGSGITTIADSGSGDKVQVEGAGNAVIVPGSYVSGNPLSDSSTYDNGTFASLGVTPGTYVWTWGSGVHADSFTLNIGAAAVPEPGSLALLVMGLAGLGMVLHTRRA